MHRLVASEFWVEAKEENQDTVNHLDHDPCNNIAHNLAWASRVEQAACNNIAHNLAWASRVEQEAWKKLKSSQEGNYSRGER